MVVVVLKGVVCRARLSYIVSQQSLCDFEAGPVIILYYFFFFSLFFFEVALPANPLVAAAIMMFGTHAMSVPSNGSASPLRRSESAPLLPSVLRLLQTRSAPKKIPLAVTFASNRSSLCRRVDT